MSRKSARFTEADIRRALAGVAKSGIEAVVEVLLDGTIRVIPATIPRISTPDAREIVL